MESLQRNPPCVVEAVESFLAQLAQMGRRPRTLARRRDALDHFLRFLKERRVTRLQEMIPELFDAYGSTMVEAGWTPLSVDSGLRSVRLFYRYLAEAGLVFEDPLARVVLGRPKLPSVHVISEEDVERLLAAPDPSSPAGCRDRTMLETLYATAIRCEELLGLRVGDADTVGQALRVIGKGDRERAVPLGVRAAECLQGYLERSRPVLASCAVQDCDALWLNHLGRPLSVGWFQILVRRYGRAVGIPRVTAHALRRSCATHMLAHGADAVSVAQLLGHANLYSLRHYLRITLPDLKTMHAGTPPGQ